MCSTSSLVSLEARQRVVTFCSSRRQLEETKFILLKVHYGWCCFILYEGNQLPKVAVGLEELCLQSCGLSQGDVFVNVTLTSTSYHYVAFFQRNNFTLHNLQNVGFRPFIHQIWLCENCYGNAKSNEEMHLKY